MTVKLKNSPFKIMKFTKIFYMSPTNWGAYYQTFDDFGIPPTSNKVTIPSLHRIKCCGCGLIQIPWPAHSLNQFCSLVLYHTKYSMSVTFILKKSGILNWWSVYRIDLSDELDNMNTTLYRYVVENVMGEEYTREKNS